MDLEREKVNTLREAGLGHSVALAAEGMCPTCAEPVSIDALAEAGYLAFYNAFGMCLDCITLHKEEDPDELILKCELRAHALQEETFNDSL